MKNNLIVTTLLIILFAGSSLAGDIITVKEFAELRKANKALVIIDANSADNYAKQHIQGAINIWHQDLYKAGTIEGLLKDPAELAAYFGKKGLSINSPMVIYDDGSQKYNSNLYWILKYLGATDVKLLHREMGEFEAARIPMTNEAFKLKPAVFTPAVNNDIVADLAFVKAEKDKPATVLLDARDKDEYEGKVEKSKGHIPGAELMSFKDVLTDKGAFKTKEQLEALAAAFKLTPEKMIVVYCYTSVKAAVVFVAFKEILGYPNVRVYDGSYNEWVAQTSGSLEKD